MSNANKRTGGALKLRRFERPSTIKEHVYNTLRRQLLHNEYDGRLIEKEITEKLGVSRTPVREALSLLASEGLLEATSHGYKVPEFSPEDVMNVFEVRMLLEPAAARQAAENSSSVGLAEMERAIGEEKKAHKANAVTQFVRANVTFRENWLKRISNPMLLALLTRAVHTLQAIRVRTLSEAEIRKFVVESHEALLSAIKLGDASAAERIQLATVKRSAELMRLTLFKGDKEAPPPPAMKLKKVAKI